MSLFTFNIEFGTVPVNVNEGLLVSEWRTVIHLLFPPDRRPMVSE